MKTPVPSSLQVAIEKCNAAGFDFVLHELELGTAFCYMAFSAEGEGEKKRRIENASHSYEAATYHARSLTLNEGQWTELNQKAEQLRLLLQ
jgi:hypothetical protein